MKNGCLIRSLSWVNEGVEPMGLLFTGYNPLRQQVLDTYQQMPLYQPFLAGQ